MQWNVVFQEEAGSSMEEVLLLAREPDQGAALVVNRQTKGRGRRGRQWASPDGGRYCSLVWNPCWPVPELPKVTLLAAVAVCEAVYEVSGLDARIKWPNDLLIGGKKIAGILVESSVSGAEIDYVTAGIGVNVNTDARDLPEGAVSLKGLTGREYDRARVFDAVLSRFNRWHDEAASRGFGNVLNRWRALCGTLGQCVRAQTAQGLVEGTAVDLAPDGGLLIQQEDGAVVRVVSADTVQIRTV
jgi:BirA family biotin operon repressor/biotin-[acetyl-CoA-carboxylase] ligase